jgi:hypothetical protein
MRRLVLILVACVPGYANMLSTSATCNGVAYYGSGSASCGEGSDTDASATSGDQSVNVSVSSVPGSSSSASAASFGVYILTATGDSGDGFAYPTLGASSGFDGAGAAGGGEVSLVNSSGDGCSAYSSDGGGLEDNCTSTSLPFVFGIPETLYLSLDASAFSSADYDTYPVGAFAGIQPMMFSFYDGYGQSLGNVTYTFAPAPEPGMFPLLAAIACATLIARMRRRKSRPVPCVSAH